MVMARGAGRHRRRLRTASSARCRCGILEGSIFCGYKFTKLGNKGDNSMRCSTISVFVVTAWLLGVAIPAAAADPALKLLLKKGIITQEEYDQALGRPVSFPRRLLPKQGRRPRRLRHLPRRMLLPHRTGTARLTLARGSSSATTGGSTPSSRTNSG